MKINIHTCFDLAIPLFRVHAREAGVYESLREMFTAAFLTGAGDGHILVYGIKLLDSRIAK